MRPCPTRIEFPDKTYKITEATENFSLDFTALDEYCSYDDCTYSYTNTATPRITTLEDAITFSLSEGVVNFGVFWDQDLSLAVDDTFSTSLAYEMTVTCTNAGEPAVIGTFDLTIESPCDEDSII